MRRDSMLGRIERAQKVEYDEWRWKVSYALPLRGKDYWTKKMEDKEKAEREFQSDVKKRKRFSWKRKSVKNKS